MRQCGAVVVVVVVDVRKSFQRHRRHPTVGEHGARRDDDSGDVSDDAVGVVCVADWLATRRRVGGVVSDGEERSLNMYEVVVWTGKLRPSR